MAFTPLAGKVGAVILSGPVSLFMRDWNLSLEADIIPADTYEKTTSNSQYFKTGLVGLIGGEATVSGLWENATNLMYSGTALAIRAGKLIRSGQTHTTVFLGVTTTIGFTLTGIIRRINPSSRVDGGNEFSFTLFVEDVAYTSQT